MNETEVNALDNNFKSRFQDLISGASSAGKNPSEAINEAFEAILAGEENGAVSSEGSYITADTIIEGSIKSKSNLNICGLVEGDISTTMDANISGKIDGGVEANNIRFENGIVNGNLNGISDITVSDNTVIVGDIKSANLSASGKIKGSIEASNYVDLKRSAVIIGNIRSKGISIQDGTVLDGYVSVIREEKPVVNIEPEIVETQD